MTGGAADAIVRAAALEQVPEPPLVPEAPLPGSPYDLVIGDLLYSQLLYPALVDAEVPVPTRAAILQRYASLLVRGLVNRMQTSASTGCVLHLHDSLSWGPGVQQPFRMDDVISRAATDPSVALRMQRRASVRMKAILGLLFEASVFASGAPTCGAGRSATQCSTSSPRP